MLNKIVTKEVSQKNNKYLDTKVLLPLHNTCLLSTLPGGFSLFKMINYVIGKGTF